MKQWIKQIISSEGFYLQQINYIFCSDSYLLKINQDFLKHDTLTDIVTFDTKEKNEANSIDGEIYISVQRVDENATLLNNNFEDELNRVIIHGILHLCGYSDKDDKQKTMMRQKENQALSLLNELQNK